MTDWQNLIVGHDMVDPESLTAHPQNWRIHPSHQGVATDDVLANIGWADEILVNKRTGYVLNGHHRTERAIARGQALVPVRYVDVDEETELRILASFDPLAQLTYRDDAKLADLREMVKVDSEPMQALIQGRRIATPWDERDFQITSSNAPLPPFAEPPATPRESKLAPAEPELTVVRYCPECGSKIEVRE